MQKISGKAIDKLTQNGYNIITKNTEAGNKSRRCFMEEVKKQELQELYSKAYAYHEASKVDTDPKTKQGYVSYLCGDMGDMVKLKVAYDQMYPDNPEASEYLQKQIDKAMQFDPARLGLYLKTIIADLAELYKKAFALFLENLKFSQREQEQKSQTNYVQKEVQPETEVVKTYQGSTAKQTKPKKQSIWSKLFGQKRTVEKVSIVELATERREMNHQENTLQKQLEQARLDRYNERVKQRANQNAMQNQMQASEPAFENQMSRF